LLWKSNLERLIAGLGKVVLIGVERQRLAVYPKTKSDNLWGYPIFISIWKCLFNCMSLGMSVV
jgi:hypothetical protein